jgi:hypothetical protein
MMWTYGLTLVMLAKPSTWSWWTYLSASTVDTTSSFRRVTLGVRWITRRAMKEHLHP